MADDPASAPQPLSRKTPPKAVAVIAAAVLVAAPLATHFEGYVSKARPDPAAIPTYCYGETENVDPARIYTKSECATLLRARMARDYAPALLKCLPELNDPARVNVFGALLDASYNAGPVAVCKSPMRIRIRAGDWQGGCRAFVGWYTTARNRKTGVRTQLPGLVTRRNAEAATCAKAAPAATAALQAAPTVAPPPVAPAPPVQRLSLLQRIASFFRHLLGT